MGEKEKKNKEEKNTDRTVRGRERDCERAGYVGKTKKENQARMDGIDEADSGTRTKKEKNFHRGKEKMKKDRLCTKKSLLPPPLEKT